MTAWRGSAWGIQGSAACALPSPNHPPDHAPGSRFVTYKWPSWLHKQTEKQRIIWAYKILFLDVLFPLGLKKVGGSCMGASAACLAGAAALFCT